MIHVSASASPTGNPEENILHFSLRGNETIKDFHALLDRALNCLPPDRHKDWVALSDNIHTFLSPKKQDER